jgi:hypothetical protein
LRNGTIGDGAPGTSCPWRRIRDCERPGRRRPARASFADCALHARRRCAEAPGEAFVEKTRSVGTCPVRVDPRPEPLVQGPAAACGRGDQPAPLKRRAPPSLLPLCPHAPCTAASIPRGAPFTHVCSAPSPALPPPVRVGKARQGWASSPRSVFASLYLKVVYHVPEHCSGTVRVIAVGANSA